MRRAALFLVFILSAAATLDARMLFMRHHPCLNGGGGSYSAGYIDDRTGMSYLMVRDCWGNICLHPLYGPFQPRVAAENEWSLPADYDGLIASSRGIKAPGVDIGVWVTDETSGDVLRFRNPVDDAEREKYYRMWLENENGGESLSIEREFNRLIEKDLAQRTTEDRMRGDLVDRYWSARFADRWPTSDEMKEFGSAAAAIASNKSNIAIKQTPTSLNGQTLIMRPLFPELSADAAIYNASGETVWSGRLDGSTTVQLDHLPSGLYVVRSLGRDMPVAIVR